MADACKASGQGGRGEKSQEKSPRKKVVRGLSGAFLEEAGDGPGSGAACAGSVRQALQDKVGKRLWCAVLSRSMDLRVRALVPPCLRSCLLCGSGQVTYLLWASVSSLFDGVGPPSWDCCEHLRS